MHFGIAFANSGPLAEGPTAAGCMRAAEAAGFDSVWTVEHVLVPADYESTYPYARSGRMPGGETSAIPDPLVWLAYVAAVTDTLLLGTGILILPQRNPAVVAKEVASLDRLSGGRVRLGIGVGWLEEEFDALGVPFAGRGKRTDAYVAAMRALWTGEPVTLDDGYQVWEKAISLPTPTNGTVPIIVGGHSEAAARRAGRLGDGFFPGKGSPEALAHLFEVMGQAAEDAGRDPASIEITAGAAAIGGADPLGAVQEMAALGVHRLIVPPLAWDPDAAVEAYGAFGETIIAKA
ncbi:TIGR03619 family F420-dependent LLM class oxidoreductase [Aquihabitans sp. G128]|uniref:TIGR03619 family F420-dependent LLM class oxidoreductase n=1 Tax=Aquihabitans sp. G128 TaxID=2849779 RepID=UPI001C221005|nr:TIGR03619 family F420-dependent LLM class oxidoreductase [Aquihabitans sp. G128]QXC61142.1 TIGR03619 family F420-dependent LLM class oxidoreductase [Aquihabitans sp. G128]